MPPNQSELLHDSVPLLSVHEDQVILTTATTTTPLVTAVVSTKDDSIKNKAVDLGALPQAQPVVEEVVEEDQRLRCAVLGCGMMGQEHISYIMGYGDRLRIDYLCDPHEPSLLKSLQVMEAFAASTPVTTTTADDSSDDESTTNNQKDYNNTSRKKPLPQPKPTLLNSEESLLELAEHIDLLVIATPNYLHTDTLLRWGRHDITILLEKPVAVSKEQHDLLAAAAASSSSSDFKARVWVAMEYRFIPAIAKLIELLPTIGDIQMCTIRENRFPFLHKIGAWNRDATKTGDTLVEKCCHFFDLMRLITGQESNLNHVRAVAQRGINYEDEDLPYDKPIIDSAYVFMSFLKPDQKVKTIGCLELCMYADGSRHQEEVIVTGTKGRLEAYLPENKVYAYERPSHKEWSDRSLPPPVVKETIHDCSNVRNVHGIDNPMPVHGGFHYSSTAVEWYRLLDAISDYKTNGQWKPQVSLTDGLRAVEIGLRATQSIVNEQD